MVYNISKDIDNCSLNVEVVNNKVEFKVIENNTNIVRHENSVSLKHEKYDFLIHIVLTEIVNENNVGKLFDKIIKQVS